MKFFIASPWKNKEQVEKLTGELETKGHEVYSFLKSGENLLTGQPIEEEMKVYWEALANWRNDKRISQIFDSEMNGLKSCEALILLLPAGDSAHMETGVAYGLSKKLILIGAINKPEMVYLMFDKIYLDATSFIKDLPSITQT